MMWDQHQFPWHGVTKEVKHLHGGKVPGVHEMLKGLGVVSSTLHGSLEHCTEQLTRWWFLFSQGGHEGVCQLQMYHMAQIPWESVLLGGGKDSHGNSQTSN